MLSAVGCHVDLRHPLRPLITSGVWLRLLGADRARIPPAAASVVIKMKSNEPVRPDDESVSPVANVHR